MWWLNQLESSSSSEEFLRRYDDAIKWSEIKFEKEEFDQLAAAAARFGVANEDLRQHYFQIAIRSESFDMCPGFVDDHFLATLSSRLSVLEQFGHPATNEELVGLLPVIERNARTLLETGTKTLENLDFIVRKFNDVVDDGFKARLQSYESKGNRNSARTYAAYGRAANILPSLKKLKSAGYLDANLENAVRTSAIDMLGTMKPGIFLEMDQTPFDVLAEIDWKEHIEDVYGGVIVSIARREQAVDYVIRRLDEGNRLPPHLAAVILYQLDSRQVDPNPVTVEFIDSRMETPSKQLLERAKASLRNIIMSRLAPRIPVSGLEFHLSFIPRIDTAPRMNEDALLAMLSLYEEMFGNMDDPEINLRISPLISTALSKNNYSSAYGLALKVAGSPEKVDISPFNAAARGIISKREFCISLANERGPFRRHENRRDAFENLEKIAGSLFELERKVGERLEYRTRDEIQSVARLLEKPFSQPLLLQYFCVILQNQKNLGNVPIAEVFGPEKKLDGLDEAFKGNYTCVARDKFMPPRAKSQILSLFDQGYTLLFGHTIRKDWNPDARDASDDRDNRYRMRPPARSSSSLLEAVSRAIESQAPEITVYFGGRRFAECRESINELIPQYKGKTSSLEATIGGRPQRFFGISMSSKQIENAVQRTILGNTVLAVEVPKDYQVNHTILDAVKLQVQEVDGRRLIYNKGQVQNLSQPQIDALRRMFTESITYR